MPRVNNRLLFDAFNSLKDPSRDIEARSRQNGCVRILPEEPLRVDLLHIRLEWLVYPGVDRLHKTGAARRNNLELNAKTLDGIGNAAEEMDLE